MDIDSLAQYSRSRLIELHLFEFVVSGRSLLLYLLLCHHQEGTEPEALL